MLGGIPLGLEPVGGYYGYAPTQQDVVVLLSGVYATGMLGTLIGITPTHAVAQLLGVQAQGFVGDLSVIARGWQPGPEPGGIWEDEPPPVVPDWTGEPAGESIWVKDSKSCKN